MILKLQLFGILLQAVFCVSLETRPLHVLIENYEDDKNAMIARKEDCPESEDDVTKYEDFYDEFDNELVVDNSMDIIFFGPISEFLRIEADSLLIIFSLTKKQMIPISKALVAWDLITDGKTTVFLQGQVYEAFDTLLNVIPEEDLYKVNFGDLSVIRYFANNIEYLEKHKLGALVSAYRRYYGDSWITNSSLINNLGYLICGFPITDLKKLTPSIFKEIDVNIFNKLKFCSYSQGQTLFKIATDHEAYGKPHSWTAHEISKLGFLFTYISREEIKSLKLHAMFGISKHVILAMHHSELQTFCKQQILRMNAEARRAFILKTQLHYNRDVGEIVYSKAAKNNPYMVIIIITILLWSTTTHFFLYFTLVNVSSIRNLMHQPT